MKPDVKKTLKEIYELWYDDEVWYHDPHLVFQMHYLMEIVFEYYRIGPCHHLPKSKDPLTMEQIESVIQTRDGLHRVDRNLYVQVTGAARSWIFRYMIHNKQRAIGLGPLDLVSLDEAKDLALTSRHMLLNGLDPLTEKRLTDIPI